MPLTYDDLVHLIGATVRGAEDERIGRVGQVYVDANGAPSWATVRTGILGGPGSFFPLQDARLQAEEVVVPFAKELVLSAPRFDADEEFTARQSDELYDYYEAAAGTRTEPAAAPPAGRDPDALELTRSEEVLRVGVRTTERGRVRLRRFIETAPETVRVLVRREEARLVREPITAADVGGLPGPEELTEEEHVVVLHGDVLTTEKEGVPVERVRVQRQSVTEQQQVTASVQKEQIEVVDSEGTVR